MWFIPENVDPRGWTPAQGYSDYFKVTVRLLREHFGLEKARAGEDHNKSGIWKEYTLQGRDVRVSVVRFRYGEIGDLGRTKTPIFYLDTVIQMKVSRSPSYQREYYTQQEQFQDPVPWWLDLLGEFFPNSQWVRERLSGYSGVRPIRRWRNRMTSPGSDGWKVIGEYPIQIVFPDNYPHVPPRFRVNSPRFINEGVSHEHHQFDGGWMCILADDEDWQYPRDNIISGLNAALDWVVLHYNRFGW